jgi:hypothetical protein
MDTYVCEKCKFTLFINSPSYIYIYIYIYVIFFKKAMLFHYMQQWRLGERYSSYSFSTSSLDGGEWSSSRPGRALPPAKGPSVLPFVQEAGWAPEPGWTQRLEKKSFRLGRGSNLDRPVVQPVTRHYTA